jgi:hypothetical protein
LANVLIPGYRKMASLTIGVRAAFLCGDHGKLGGGVRPDSYAPGKSAMNGFVLPSRRIVR